MGVTLARKRVAAVEPRDPTFALRGVGCAGRRVQDDGRAALLLVAVATVAAWLPARRAARIDPVRVLRQSDGDSMRDRDGLLRAPVTFRPGPRASICVTVTVYCVRP